MSRFNIAWVIPAFALVVTVDQWVGATGAADPFVIQLFGKPFSFMAAARGIVIVLAVTYALHQLRSLGNHRQERRIARVLVASVVVMLTIETFVIAPYSMSAMAATDLAKTLQSISPALYFVWSVFVAAMSLLAVGTAAVASLAVSREEMRKGNRENRVGRPFGSKNKNRKEKNKR